MNAINENINEDDFYEIKMHKKKKKKNSDTNINNDLTKEKQSILVSKKNSNINKKNTVTYTSNLSIKHQKEYEQINNSLNKLANKIISKNKTLNISLSEKILLELFINISEFNESNFDFFVSYQNLCSMLNSKGLLNREIYNNVVITKSDLDIILKEILTNKNASKKLNYNNFVRFLAYLSYNIDPMHFIDKPKRTFNFIINFSDFT
jgi:effector-binding domain-containing protein